MASIRKSKKQSTLTNQQLDLQAIKPKTENQKKFFERYDSGMSQLVTGYPGTGKTFLAMYKGFEEINDPRSDYNKLIIVRSSVPTRDIGFLPGTLAEKNAVYELPYSSICSELFHRGDAYSILKKHGIVDFITTSFIRGTTLDRAIIIADEVQNMTAHEADSIITRGSDLSKTIFCGDILQQDLTRIAEKNIEKFLRVLTQMEEDFGVTHFEQEDIVRGGLVKNYIKKKHSIFPDGF